MLIPERIKEENTPLIIEKLGNAQKCCPRYLLGKNVDEQRGINR